MAYNGDNDSMKDFFNNMKNPDKFRAEYRGNMRTGDYSRDEMENAFRKHYHQQPFRGHDERDYERQRQAWMRDNGLPPTVIIFHPDRNATGWFVDMMGRLPVRVDFQRVHEIEQLRGYTRETPIWVYDSDNWPHFDIYNMMGFIKSRFQNIKEIPRLKEPWRDEFKAMFEPQVNVNHNSEECEAYKEFIRVVKEEKVDEAKAIKAICALYEIEPHQLFSHRDCGKKKEKPDMSMWGDVGMYINGESLRGARHIIINQGFDIGFNLKDLDV